MTDRRGVVAKRAENLAPDVPYIRGWNRARRGAGALADQLVLLGLDCDFPGLVADVNVAGDGLVHLGPVRPEAADLLAGLIAAGLQAELHDVAAGEPPATRRRTPAA
ncbi:hypothetical protein KBZ94_08550 [Streptomyces sp. RM72]|uniref:hypothetical protein n=1 Tax=Streptomyces sp. RM72 TaxID=1115510 RepID=UPI001B383741|nr:hypothetical protein [Streptomyces sp. RM72]MBQ0884989.1 hypothetical protein [Streptomyces sp. RM72]